MNETASGRWVHPAFELSPIDRTGPFLNEPDGRLLTIDAEGIRLSGDDGKTWSESSPASHGQNPIKEPGSCYLLRADDNSIVMVFLDLADYKFEWDEVKGEPEKTAHLGMYAIRSADNGKTWTGKQQLLDGYNANFFGFIKLRSGRLVTTAEHLMSNPGRWVVCSFYSDDNGKSWRQSNFIDIGGHGHHDGATEPGIVELSDGRVMMLIRTNLDRFWQAFSDDGGRYWRVIQPTSIDASSAPGHIIRLQSGRLVLVWNRLNPENGDPFPKSQPGPASEIPASWYREELSVSLSDDDAKNWSNPLVIARQKGGQLSYPHIFERRPGEIWINAGFAFQNGWKDPLPLRLKIHEEKLLIECMKK